MHRRFAPGGAALAAVVLALAVAACGSSSDSDSSSNAASSKPLAGAPSWCGSKKITLALADGFGDNNWRRITTAEALHAYTAANAFGGFQEAKLGTLAPGKLGDFVVLDSDIFRVAPDRIGATRILRTIVDGKERYADSAA